jgi:hypothetical protein
VLRYVYDQVTQEFVNVGIVAYSPESRQLRAYATQQYSRVSDLFDMVDGVRLRHTLRFIQDSVNARSLQLAEELEFRPSADLHEILNKILPIDDSSLRFDKAGAGLADNFEETAKKLFVRYVERYSHSASNQRRDDNEVWKSFRTSLDRKDVTRHLVPKRIVAKYFDYEFERSWKNGVWHIYEPLSFDLLDAHSMAEKANRWVGRATGLADSDDEFELHFLLGAPSDPRLETAFRKAENLLNKMTVKHQFVRESEAEQFASALAMEIDHHGKA